MKPLLKIDAGKAETEIIRFLKKVFFETRKKQVVLGWSGGVDSTVCLYLLTKVLRPEEVFVYHLPYQKTYIKELIQMANQLRIPRENIREVPIKKIVDVIIETLSITEKIRKGNCMARVRMITLFDQAKLHDALVCGTENRTEHLLGYFTRYGDAASDIEPICHLYKTQIYQVAEYLQVPQTIIKRSPTAGLWEGQTDEGEFGFTYKEADEVLCLYVDKKKTVKDIENLGLKNARRIIERVSTNSFKHKLPYFLSFKRGLPESRVLGD